MIFINNKYSKWYYSIINNAVGRNSQNIYTESHHIVPKSLGGDDDKANLATLTAREHFVCHLLLTKMVHNAHKGKMVYAVWAMANQQNPHQYRSVVSSRTYHSLREKFSEEHSKRMSKDNPMRSPLVKQKHLNACRLRGKTMGMTGKTHRDSTRAKMREARRTQVITEETKEKLRQINLNKSLEDRAKHKAACQNQPKASCIYCGAVMTAGPLARHHGDNCKLNPQSDSSSQR